MRRWFMVFMLTLLPLQFSWAAVAAYCGHESVTVAGVSESAETAELHLGHHAHQHVSDAQADARTAGDDGTAAGFDFDCGHCHSSCCSLPLTLCSLAPISLSSSIAEPLPCALRTRAQVPPERPQWRPLA